MLKKISFFALVALAAASCNIKETRPDCLTPVTVHVSEFAISMKDLPTKTVIEARDYADVKALTLAIFSSNTEVFSYGVYKVPIKEDVIDQLRSLSRNGLKVRKKTC